MTDAIAIHRFAKASLAPLRVAMESIRCRLISLNCLRHPNAPHFTPQLTGIRRFRYARSSPFGALIVFIMSLGLLLRAQAQAN